MRSDRVRWAMVCLMLAGRPCMAQPAAAPLGVERLACERRVDPIDVGTAAPRLSWIVTSRERGQRQRAYRVLVARSAEALARDEGDLWDTGKAPGSETLNVVYAGVPLAAGQVCHWKVRVWGGDDTPSAWSEPSVWEVGLLTPGDWKGRWINDGKATPVSDADQYAEDPAPLFRREFELGKPVRRARLHISGLGYYEASINGVRLGDRVLEPGWTDYRSRAFSTTLDVGACLREGVNCIGVTLGNGWYNPLPLRMWGHLNLREHLAVGRPRFIARLVVEHHDGTVSELASGTEWRVGEGPIRFNNVYLGEIYDARLEAPGWDTPGFDDGAWRVPGVASEPIGLIEPQPQPPIRTTERFAAARVTEPAPGVHIYDMGQNFAGWASVRFGAARLPTGTRVVLRYAELLNPDGTLNPLTGVCGQIKGTRRTEAGEEESVGGPGAPAVAWQTDTYIAAGASEGETYTPRFTFHAFRYLEITGLAEPLPLDAVTGVRLHSDVRRVGSFECSNERFNEIQRMCSRTFLSNIFGVQSDCPHRERFGYGGDIAATCDAFLLNFDMSTFYAKAVRDWADAARADGMLTDTAPFVGIQYCGVGWAMAHPLLLDELYRYHAERRLIDEQYDAAKRWLLLVAASNPDGIIKDGLGDHESLEPAPAAELVTPLFVRSAEMLARLARLRGLGDDAARFDAIARASRAAYQGAFIDGATGRVGPGTQASQSIALAMGMVPEELRPKAVAYLVEHTTGLLDPQVKTGIMGTRCMLDVLSREGHGDLVAEMVDRTAFPGWGWMLENGATTLWEHWTLDTNTFSHNHPMFGSVSQWFINWLGGIQPAPDAVGFDSIVIRPQPVGGLTWVRCGYDSARGPIVSNWRREDKVLTMEVEIPANTKAEVHIPAGSDDAVRESGKELADAPGVIVRERHAREIVCDVGSGRYVFTVRTR